MSLTRQEYLRIGGQDLSAMLSDCYLEETREMPEGLPGLAAWRIRFNIAKQRDALANVWGMVGEPREVEVRARNAAPSLTNPARIGQGFLISTDTPYTIVASSALRWETAAPRPSPSPGAP